MISDDDIQEAIEGAYTEHEHKLCLARPPMALVACRCARRLGHPGLHLFVGPPGTVLTVVWLDIEMLVPGSTRTQ